MQAKKRVSTITAAAVQMQRAPSCIPAANVPAMKVTPEMDTRAHVSIICTAFAY